MQIILLVFLGTYFLGCIEDFGKTEQNEPNKLTLGVEGITTRALDDAFTTSDEIGIYAVKLENGNAPTLYPSDNYGDNIKYFLATEPDKWDSNTPIYFPNDGAKLNLYAYYPYRENVWETNEGSTIIHFTIETNQSIYTAYTSSDFALAFKDSIERTSEKVNLTFDHKLSQLVFRLKAGNDFSREDITSAKITIKNAIIDVKHDLSEGKYGIPVIGNQTADVIPNGVWTTSIEDETLLYGVKGIIAPQELNENTYFEITLGTRIFNYKFYNPLVLQSGESRSFTITLNDNDNYELELSTTLNPWNYGDPVEGIAVEEIQDSFITEWEVPANQTITLLLDSEYKYNFKIDWGDNSAVESITGGSSISHTYQLTDTYEIKISGICEYINMNSSPYIKSVKNWGATQIKAWSNSFNGCINLTSIPPYMPDAELFNGVFNHCDNLNTIPENLFKNCTSAKNFVATFRYSKIQTIPENLFEDCANVETFEATFSDCYELEVIPGNLFSTSTKAVSFLQLFHRCSKLKSIPAELFSNCPSVTTFDKAFYLCTSLTAIPTRLFDNCKKVTNFSYTFGSCQNVTGVTPSTNGIELWMRSASEYTQYPNTISLTGCFNGCTRLSNYSSIPSSAK